MTVTGAARWTGARPGLRFVVAHPAHFIAFVGVAGLVRPAPGTWGTLAALPAWWAMQGRLGDAQIAGVIAALFAIGVWAAHVTGRSLGVQDHGGIVIDEFVAMLAVLLVLPRGPAWEATGFLLFRLFDIAKPPPIRHYERSVRGGFGVMFDDALAALAALMVVAAWQRMR
jgi:phosphatidylglycerophosphatase A